ncbi:MAG: PKD-like domain-containing protein, partial [Dolichospermum sp.]
AQTTGVSSISQTLTNTTNASATLTYTVTPTSGTSGNCVGNTFTITVTVNPQAGISNQTTAICSGNAFSITPSGVPNGTTYTWSAPSLPTGVAVTSGNTGNAQSSINATLTNNTTGALDAVFTVTPSSGGCGSGTFDITVTVNPKPNIAQQSISICSGSAFTITPATTLVPIGTTYTWSAPSGSGFTGGAASSGSPTTITGTLTNSTNTVQTATYSIKPISGAGGSCEGSNFNTIVTINPKPSIAKQTRTICSGETFSLTITNGSGTIVPANTTYTWSTPTVTSGITGGTSGTNATNVSGTLNNTTNTTQTATYTVTPTSGIAGNCVGEPFIVEITVNPKPVIANYTRTVCSGNAFTVTPTHGDPSASTIVPTGTTYKWTAPTMPTGVTGGTVQTTGVNSISQTLTNNTNTPKTVTYTVTPSIGGCDGATFTISVIVNPTPKVIAQTSQICSGNSFTLPLSNNEPSIIIPTGTTYTWATPTGDDVTGGAAGNNQTTISGTLFNATNTSKTATYSITPTSGTDGACVGSAFNLVVTINPIPAITTTIKDPTTCGTA